MKKKKSIAVSLLFLIVHLIAVTLCYPYFTWEGVVLAASLWVLFSIGITIVYHRYLTHTGFQTYGFIRKVSALWVTLAGEGPPIMWVTDHRQHHKYSDEPGDPHSPRDGFGHAHIWWMTLWECPRKKGVRFRRYVPDLLKEGFMRFLNKAYFILHIAFAGLLFAVGWLYEDLFMGMSFLVYGYFVRTILVWHGTWFVNSATHIWGYTNYDTGDESKNLWWVAAAAQGEGWHNNHHAHPRCTWHGHRWWEFDVSGRIIWLMKKAHLIWNVQDKIPKRQIGNTT